MVALSTSAPESLDITEEMHKVETVEEDDEGCDDEILDYEQCREERIRENRERMQKLGIFDLSQKLNSIKPTPVRAVNRRASRLHTPLPPPPSAPVRRSSRLQTSTPVSYYELPEEKKGRLLKNVNILREEGSKPEVYTEEHDKLLGSTEMNWTLFVDGYGSDGKRVYDPIKGKTCHQCRQKTLGHRTQCSNCNMVQGQFCGDCLYMRYGENVLEAKANPDWLCPVCRGICNCSLCRQAKGWPPTGTMYKKISSLGYKSVAHYLIQTRCANTDAENKVDSVVPVSAKRSLPFSDIEVTGEGDDLFKPDCERLNPDPNHVPASDKEYDDAALKKKDQVEYPLKIEPGKDSSQCDDDKETTLSVGSELDKSTVVCITAVEPKTAEPLNNVEKEKSVLDNKDDIVAPEASLRSTKKRASREATAEDSIGARLRRRRDKGNTSEELQLVIADHTQGPAEVTTPATAGIATRTRKRCRVS